MLLNSVRVVGVSDARELHFYLSLLRQNNTQKFDKYSQICYNTCIETDKQELTNGVC